jgi:DNA-binding transcriptional LysR family regulator
VRSSSRTVPAVDRYCKFFLILRVISEIAIMRLAGGTRGRSMAQSTFPNISSRQLRAVVAVAQYRSFIAAATALNLSQPAITRIVKQVEAELGAPLFIRSTRLVSVTDFGKEFAALAERLVNDLRINVAHMRRQAEQPRGQIVVSSVFSPVTVMLSSLVTDYCRRFPGIQIHLREGLHGAVRDDVRSGLADFGLGFAEDALGTFVIENLGIERLHVVLPEGHALAGKRTLTVSALVGQPLVSFPLESMTRRLVDSAAAAHGLSLNYAVTTNRLATLHGLVRNRIGIAVVPAAERPAIGDPHLVTRPLKGQQLSCRTCLMRLRERALTPPAAAFMALARKWYRARPDHGA